MAEPLIISPQTRCRFLLGAQGLWPGRRWRGAAGVATAAREMVLLQMDPTLVVAQSHDQVLWQRVIGYQPAMLTDLLYKQRKFFDYGGGLAIFPIEELPYTRTVMQRKAKEKRWAAFAAKNGPLLASMRKEFARRGPLSTRDFESDSTDKWNYRSGKESGVALYYLWLTGELMISHRAGKERVYDLLPKLAPKKLQKAASVPAMEEYYAQEALRLHRLITPRAFRNTWKGFIERFVDHPEGKKKFAQLIKNGTLVEVRVEGEKESQYARAEDISILEQLNAGKYPKAWRPLETNTDEEVVFLSPLEYISARGKAKLLFDFDYIWEIYKPAEKRKYGPYTMPILYGDRLVARADFKLDREQHTLVINGVWPESWFAPDAAFGRAYQRGLRRFAEFLGAESVDAGNVKAEFKKISKI